MRRFYSFFIVLLLPLTTSVSQSQDSKNAGLVGTQIEYRNPVSDTLRTPLAVTYRGYAGDTVSAVQGLRSELASILPATYYKRMTPSAKIVLFNPDNTLQTLHEVNPYAPVLPASVEKMFTTSTILWALGAKYDFTTKLDIVAPSRVESGSVVGNVYLRPSGDPTLKLADFTRLAEELKAKGIRQIEGDIVSDLTVDDVLTPDAKRYFAQQNMLMEHQAAGDTLPADLPGEDTVIEEDITDAELSDEEDMPGYFSSSPNYFIDRNMLALRIAGSSKKGAAPSISLYPNINAVKIVNKATTSAGVTYRKKRIKVGKGKKARYRTVRQRIGGRYTIHISSSGGENGAPQVITVTGQIPARQDRSLSVPIKDVPLAMAGLLKWKLEQEGIRVAGVARTGTPPKGADLSQTLAEKRTPLIDLLSATNKPSDNFLAEALFRKLSTVADIGSANPRDRSERMIRSFLNVVNASSRSAAFADGSGLSRENHVTAAGVIELLRGIRSRQEMYSDFCNSLTVAGVDGTLRGRMIGTYAHGNAHGKTGTLNGVTALAGYVATKDGQLASYFITMQNFGGGASQYKRIQDQIVMKLANFSYAEYTAKYSPVQATPALEPVTAPGIQKQ